MDTDAELESSGDSRVRERIMKLRARSDEISLKERRVGSDVSVQEMTEGKSCASRPKGEERK